MNAIVMMMIRSTYGCKWRKGVWYWVERRRTEGKWECNRLRLPPNSLSTLPYVISSIWCSIFQFCILLDLSCLAL